MKLLVGNKKKDSQRVVEQEDIEYIKQDYELEYLEVCSNDAVEVNNMFEKAAKLILQKIQTKSYTE